MSAKNADAGPGQAPLGGVERPKLEGTQLRRVSPRNGAVAAGITENVKLRWVPSVGVGYNFTRDDVLGKQAVDTYTLALKCSCPLTGKSHFSESTRGFQKLTLSLEKAPHATAPLAVRCEIQTRWTRRARRRGLLAGRGAPSSGGGSPCRY